MPSPPQRKLVSVVMPVHNALPFLDEAVESILGQGYADFDFVIFDDGSTDGSTERLHEWAKRDARIRLHESRENLGPTQSSNAVVAKAQTPLIARMDADDVSLPDRLERQVALLDRHPNVGLVASLCEMIDGESRVLRGPDWWRLHRKSWMVPFPHSSIMFRRELFDAVGGYRRQCEFWEDQDLVVRMAARTRIMTIPAALCRVRYSPVSTRIISNRERVEQSVDLMYRATARLGQGEGYDALLDDASRPADGRIDPRVFVSLGSLVLWRGGRPRLFRRLLKRARLGPDFTSLTSLVWTAWASLSPGTLRAFLALLTRARNGLAGGPHSSMSAVEWHPPAKVPMDK